MVEENINSSLLCDTASITFILGKIFVSKKVSKLPNLRRLTAQSRQSAKLFLQSLELGLPQPLTSRRVCPPPFGSGGGAHSLAGELGGPNSDEGTYTVVLLTST